MNVSVTLTAIQLTWIAALVVECAQTLWWWHVAKNNRSSSGMFNFDGLFESILWLLCTAGIVIVALIATVILK